MADLRKQKRTSRLSVVISFVFHAILIGILVFVAAREGMLGKDLKKIAVTMVPKEKPPEEKPKEKPPEPKPQNEPPKTETPKTPPPEAAKTVEAPPPSTVASPAAAPPAATSPTFDFDGGKAVETTSDPNVIYKGYMEYTLRSRWHRPEGIADEHYVVEVEVTVDREGHLLSTTWKKGSGDTAWDDSVKKALADTPNIGRPPPKGFPEQVLVRFDVQVPTDISLE